MAKTEKLVRYVSPFGSPASMFREQAEAVLAEDTMLWEEMEVLGLLDERCRRIGKPRLDDNAFHLRDLPAWTDGTEFDTIRALVQEAQRRASDAGEVFVVACRDGKTAAFPHRFVIDGDDVRWCTGPHMARKLVVPR